MFERFLLQIKGNSGTSQHSLFPKAVTFSATDFVLLMEMEKEILALGFRFEIFGKNTLLISGSPADMVGGEKELLEGLLEQYKKNQSELYLPIQENLARALSKRTSIKVGQKMEMEEMKGLVEQLFACANPNYSPEGKPTFFTFESAKLESYFNR